MIMKEQICNYLIEELYPTPSCNTCHYFNQDLTRTPCCDCDNYERYKLNKGHRQDVENITKGIIKIICDNIKK